LSEEPSSKAQETAQRVQDLAEEVETHAEATLGGAGLEMAKAVLRQWIDGAAGVVVSPAVGRVTLIDENGRPASISSPDLTYRLIRAGVSGA
jgi:hypothetical protein